MKPFILMESPFAGDVAKNLDYARHCLRECIDLGEIPFASHLLYTQPNILDDVREDERLTGIELGLAWHDRVDKVVVYTDFGISKGMAYGIAIAKDRGLVVEYRSYCNFDNWHRCWKRDRPTVTEAVK